MKTFQYLLIAFTFVSCISKNNQLNVTGPNNSLVIYPENFEKNNLSLSIFAEDLRYIPLSNKLLIGRVHNAKITSNALYLVYDNSGGSEGNGHPQLYRFDKNGQNPVMIGKIGKGPNEYLSGNSFAVDELKNRIYINGLANTVLVYDTLGNYIRAFKFQNPELRFSKLNVLSSNRLFLPQSPLGAKGVYLWHVIDTLGNTISSKKNSTPPFETNKGSYSETFNYKDKISYWIDYNDTIFSISPDLNCHASYIIALDESRDDKLKLESPFTSFSNPSDYYLPRSFIETNKYLINRYSYKRKYAFTFIDKKSQETYTCNYKLGKGGIMNDFDAGLSFFPVDYFTDGKNEFLSMIIQAFELKAYIASDSFKKSTPKHAEKKKALEKLANSLNVNDNPVLMIVKLKNNNV